LGSYVRTCSCTHASAETSQLPPGPSPGHWGSYTRALLVSQNRRHLFVTPRVFCLIPDSTSKSSGGMRVSSSPARRRFVQSSRIRIWPTSVRILLHGVGRNKYKKWTPLPNAANVFCFLSSLPLLLYSLLTSPARACLII
jgi:hypothetical protein